MVDLFPFWITFLYRFDFFNSRKPLSKVNILFIDDEHEEFAIIKTLSESREYWNVESMWDLDHLNNSTLMQSDVIFLDIQWIWKKMNFKNGTSLVDSIATKYPKKIITVYSSKGFPKDACVKSWVKTIPKNSTHEFFSSYIKDVWQNKQ